MEKRKRGRQGEEKKWRDERKGDGKRAGERIIEGEIVKNGGGKKAEEKRGEDRTEEKKQR